MRRWLLIMIVLLALAVVLPNATISWNQWLGGPQVRVEQQLVVRVQITPGQPPVTMPLEDYLVGVVAAEMPAAFPLEALKAQAVASRTYALKRIEANRINPSSHHPGADLCIDSNHCQGWLSEEDLRLRWGRWEFARWQRQIKQAVTATRGEVITYERRLIDPVYHSNSGGITESAEAFWQNRVPYLQSVPSPWDQDSPKFRTATNITLRQLQQVFGLDPSRFSSKERLLAVTARSATGRIQEIRVGNQTIPGQQFRNQLGLNSTAVQWQWQGDDLLVISQGYGHGVGMSQWGARGMALDGYTYRDILRYYYTGIQIETY